MSTRLALTTVGLSVTDETLVKSMLRIVYGKTSARWKYTDDIDADLVLCDPQSSLLAIVLGRAAQSRRPRCVAFIRNGQSPFPLTQSIHAPLRLGPFMDMLEASTGNAVEPEAATLRIAQAADPLEGGIACLAERLRRVQAETDATGVWRIECAGEIVHVFLPERRFELSTPLDSTLAAHLAANTRALQAVRLDPATEAQVRAVASPRPLDELLWLLGLHAAPDTYPPWLAEESLLLRQWPDMGRLGAARAHMALCALMARQPQRCADLAVATAQPLSQVLAFAHACALTGLLERHRPAQIAAPSMARRVSGLFRSMRSALGMGG